LIEKNKINALIRYSYSEIEYQINALQNMIKLRFYGLEDMSYLNPYKKLLKDMEQIRDNLVQKYDDAVADNNRNTEEVEETYNREIDC
tara:strand:+ start:622 stop:885 length:264 start_codon:yes stop_codon:yes gene_type:complete